MVAAIKWPLISNNCRMNPTGNAAAIVINSIALTLSVFPVYIVIKNNVFIKSQAAKIDMECSNWALFQEYRPVTKYDPKAKGAVKSAAVMIFFNDFFI
jgi:hypothetical protein